MFYVHIYGVLQTRAATHLSTLAQAKVSRFELIIILSEDGTIYTAVSAAVCGAARTCYIHNVKGNNFQC